MEIHDSEDHLTERGLEASTSGLLPEGSLLMVVRSGILQHTIPIAITRSKVTVNQDIRVMHPNGSIQADYLLRQIQGLQKPFLAEWVKQGATVESIEHKYFAETPMVVPSQEEQADIASYLANQTREVDALIAEKEELLRLMAEFRATGTTEILTKGLNPEAPMRKSDLPGLEEIPAHWSVLRLKFLAEVQSGIAKGKDVEGIDTVSMPYLRVANVQDGYLNLEEVSYLPVAKSEVPRYLLKPFDVLMNEGGDYDKLGRGTIWHGEIEPCIHQNHVFAVRPHEKEDAFWLAAITRTSYAKFYFMGRAKQSTNLASISQRNIMELPVLLPPREERNELLRAAADHEAKVDALVEHVKEHIELLREYKSALISEAVTGQIDVRGYAATCSEASVEVQAA